MYRQRTSATWTLQTLFLLKYQPSFPVGRTERDDCLPYLWQKGTFGGSPYRTVCVKFRTGELGMCPLGKDGLRRSEIPTADQWEKQLSAIDVKGGKKETGSFSNFPVSYLPESGGCRLRTELIWVRMEKCISQKTSDITVTGRYGIPSTKFPFVGTDRTCEDADMATSDSSVCNGKERLVHRIRVYPRQ